MYRFLWSARWLGGLAAALALATVMVQLGGWQYDRYQARGEINARIDAGGAPVPLAQVLSPPAAGDRLGPPVPPEAAWRLVEVTGHYDPDHQVLIRGRSHQGRVGYEVVTPLVLADGSAVLVDRGWLPPSPEGPTVLPPAPAPPRGPVTVTGWLRPAESGGRQIEAVGDTLHTRRIAVADLATHLPYPLFHGYLHAADAGGAAAADEALTPVPPRRENAMLNAAYAVQWWLFAALVLAGFVWLVRREARQRAGAAPDRAEGAPGRGVAATDRDGGEGRGVRQPAAGPGAAGRQ